MLARRANRSKTALAIFDNPCVIKMTEWIIIPQNKPPKLKDPILIEGLPGIGNVAKIAVDYLIDELEPVHICDIYSHCFPHAVFIDEDNIIDIPKVSLFAIKTKVRDFIFLAGDIQPMGESESYEFCTKILDLSQKLGCREVMTLGGIGLPSEPSQPKVYGIATDEKTKKKYAELNKNILFKDSKAATIVGAAGLLLGLGKLRGWPGASLLVETFAHQFHLGLKEAKILLRELIKTFNMDVDLNSFDKEIKKEEDAMKKAKSIQKSRLKMKGFKASDIDTSYIG